MKSVELCLIEQDPLSIEVASLKEHICKRHNIQAENVILIANGGICVQDGVLSTYNCGDGESNPLFVFLRDRKMQLMDVSVDNSANKEIKLLLERVREVVKTQGSSMALLRDCESMSSFVVESSKKINMQIRTSVRDQFLLVEGWNAAVANLCDSLQSMEKRIISMKDNLLRFQNCDLEVAFQMIRKFNERKLELEKVHLLAALLEDRSAGEEVPVNLLQWFLHKDKKTKREVTVQSIVEEAHEAFLALMGLSDEDELTVGNVRDLWGERGMVAEVVKGIGEGEQVLQKCKPIQQAASDDDEEGSVESGRDHYTSSRSLMGRLNYLGGMRSACSSLVDSIRSCKDKVTISVRQCEDGVANVALRQHCAGARQLLENIGKYFSEIAEWLHKAACSKADLATNIDDKKNWLVKNETAICKIDETVFLTKENIRRVRTGCNVLEQMGSAPRIYAQGVAEIRRRKQFLDIWYDWGNRCSKLSVELRSRDHEQRMKLEKDLENHIIQSLFCSLQPFSLPRIGSRLLKSSPPLLPHISDEDISLIASSTPSLTPFLQVPTITEDTLQSLYKDLHNVSDVISQTVDDPDLIVNGRIVETSLSLEDVSLMAVPQDANNQLDELYLSMQGLHFSQQNAAATANVGSSEGGSSKMARSIDSMDFQLTNDKTTETGRDLVCVSRVTLESMFSSMRELRSTVESVKQDCRHHITIQNERLVEVSTIVQQRLLEGRATEVERPPAVPDANTVTLKLRQFVPGDTVCFTSQAVNAVLQWRMLTTDGKIYFLHDDSSSSPRPVSRTHRDSIMVLGADDLPEALGGLSPPKHSPKLSRTSAVPSSVIWGTFVTKEEYIAKKPSNRFGLPLNTKFFRVRANLDRPI